MKSSFLPFLFIFISVITLKKKKSHNNILSVLECFLETVVFSFAIISIFNILVKFTILPLNFVLNAHEGFYGIFLTALGFLLLKRILASKTHHFFLDE